MVALLSLLFVDTVLKIIFLLRLMYFNMTFQYEGIILIIALKVKIGEILGQIPTCQISDLKHHLFDFTYLILE